MKIAILVQIGLAMTMMVSEAFAERIHDSQGRFVGSTYTSGNTTYIRDSQGRNLGSIRR